MLRHERIRRFSYLRYLIKRWTGEEDLNRFIEVLKETEGEVIDRLDDERFKVVHSIELIKFYLGLECTKELDRRYLSKKEREECDSRTIKLYKKRLEEGNWGDILEE